MEVITALAMWVSVEMDSTAVSTRNIGNNFVLSWMKGCKALHVLELCPRVVE